MAAPGALANPTSFAESNKILIWPDDIGTRTSIPIWMKFFCYEFMSGAVGRASAYSRSQNGLSIPGLTKMKASISVPAPANFTSTTAHTYKSEAVVPTLIGEGPVVSLAKDLLNVITPESVKKFIDAAIQKALTTGTFAAALGKFPGFNQMVEADFSDLVYKSGGQVRQYDVQLYMPCMTVGDSKKAGEIIRTFEALSLPTALSVPGIPAATFFFHPPLWVFGVGPLDHHLFDPDWSGFPQLCVLRTVKNKKIAIETNSLSAISNFEGEFKPIAYTLTLVFQELEPAIRITNPGPGGLSTKISNSSGAIVATGTTTPGRVFQ